MFEPFTREARKAITIAQEEAQRFGVSTIDPGHILLGIMASASGAAAKARKSLGISLRSVRKALKKLTAPPSGAGAPASGDFIFSRQAKKVIERAFEEARALRQEFVGAEHLLLGVVEIEESIAVKALLECGITPEMVRASVYEAMKREYPGRGIDEIRNDLEEEPPCEENDSTCITIEVKNRKGSPQAPFLPFSAGALKVITGAYTIAQGQGASRVGTEHFLPEILTDMHLVKSLRLKSRDIEKILKKMGTSGTRRRGKAASGTIDNYSMHAKRAIELAYEEARLHNHTHVEKEHFLLGILALPESTACKALIKSGVDCDRLRQRAGEILADRAPETLPSTESRASESHSSHMAAMEEAVKNWIEHQKKALQEELVNAELRGLEKGREEAARRMKAKGVDAALISEYTGLSLKRIERL